MTRQEIQNFNRRVSAFIDYRRLRDAILEIKDAAHKRMIWEVEDRMKLIEQNYAYMLQYMTQGASDPERNSVYNTLVNDIYTQLDTLVNRLDSIDNPSLYYSNIRFRRLHPEQSVSDIAKKLKAKYDNLGFAMLFPGENDNKALRAETEKLQSELFILVWTTPLLTTDDTNTLEQLLASSELSGGLKRHIISALTLGLLEQYDKRRLYLLLYTYLNINDIKVTSAALVGLLLGLWKYPERPLTDKLNAMLMSAKDKPSWQRDLRITFIEMIRARDTERINRKMRDEVIPKMEKLRPDMINKIKDIDFDPEDPMSLQENPEWKEILDKSGVTDQLKELTEIQMEGGDVMMSTFAHLKQFPFFQNISNWFLPFDANHTSVTEIMQQFDVISDMMENARFLCDSDKYSFMYALRSMPDNQKEMMISQMKSQSDTIYEAMSNMAQIDDAESRRLAVNSYMQNIYRFFKLFYRKDEFFDPFDRSINLITVPTLADDFDDMNMLQIVAEFYFKLRYMRDALNVYQHMEQLSPGDASRYQKMGYCYERLKDYNEAIECYQRAELLDNHSSWVLKRLASCYRAIGEKSRALKYYKQLAALQPDDLNTSLLYGQSLMENEDYQEAIHQFYKVEFLDEKSTKVWRPLAWTLFITGDISEAEKYYKKILSSNPDDNDFLNMGHVALAKGNIPEAIDHYKEAIKYHKGDVEWFIQAMIDDKPFMQKAGIDTSLTPLVADATLYSM